MEEQFPETAHRSERDGKIVVLGGYGAVGRVVTEILGDRFPGNIVVAGRDLGRAEQVARSNGSTVTAMRVDVEDDADVERMLNGAAIVVMCVERANERVARACLERGVHYVDISATTSVVDSVAQWDDTALRNNATAVLSVGVAPGLTNVLARHCIDRLPTADRIEISMLLGEGGEHGTGSIQWLVDQFTERPDPVGRRAEPARVRMPGVGYRIVHPFPFSDQRTVSDMHGVQAITRICFDSALTTSAVFGLRSMGLFTVLRVLRAKRLLVGIFSKIHGASDRFILHVSASDPSGNTTVCTAIGRDTCRATGVVAARVARELYLGNPEPGVRHADQLVPYASLRHALEEQRIAFSCEGSARAG